MYRIMKSTNNGMDELELDSLEKGCWIDIVSPSPEELHEVADATGIQMDFLSAALDDEEKSRIRNRRRPDTHPYRHTLCCAATKITTPCRSALSYRQITSLPSAWNLTPLSPIFLPTTIKCSAPLKRRAFSFRYYINRNLISEIHPHYYQTHRRTGTAPAQIHGKQRTF